MAEEKQELELDTNRLRAMGTTLKGLFTEYEKARQPREQQWLKNVRQFIGEYDPAVLGTFNENQSRAYPRITRVKCLAMVARLHALLFPAGEKNWGVEPSPKPHLPIDKLHEVSERWMREVGEDVEAQVTQEELDRLISLVAREIADAMEGVIDDQLRDAAAVSGVDYPALVRDVLFSGVMYGCGVLKGPMTVVQSGSGVLRADDTGRPVVIEMDLYRPYFEAVSIWDYYPDFSAKDFSLMNGVFQRHVYSASGMQELAGREDFLGDAIRNYLRDNPEGNYRPRNYESDLKGMSSEGEATQPRESKKYEMFEYWGPISGHDLRAAGVEIPDSELAKTAYGCVWIIDDTVIKAAKAPYESKVDMYHHFVFETDEVNLTGSGLPVIMRDSQLGVANFTRMLVDNAATVCGPNVEVDVDQISDATNPTTITPFKVWLKDNPSPNGGRAVQSVSFDSHINELQSAIQMFRELADTETFLSPMTGGDMEQMPSEALRTQGNMSMAMGNAALPFKDIVRNFDRFTTSVIHSLIQWNLVYHEDADRLNGDLRPIAKGASSLMAKEVRAYTLDMLATTLTEDERLYINEEELLKARLSVRDLPLEKLLASPEEVKRRRQERAEQAQAQQATAQEALQAQIQLDRGRALKETTAAQRNLDNADVATAKVLLEAMEKGADLETIRQIVSAAATRRGAQALGAGADGVPAGEASPAGSAGVGGAEVIDLAGGSR